MAGTKKPHGLTGADSALYELRDSKQSIEQRGGYVNI